jgi:RNA polymerase sigma factor (sigma-70 family)
MLCETNAVQVERALARLRSGEGGAFDDLVLLAYDWLGRRVAALLRSYPSVRLPPDEVLHDRVLARLRTALASAPPPTCEELTRLADRHIRWALRDLVRGQRDRAGVVGLEAASGVGGGREGPADPAAGDALADFLDHRERAKFHAAAAALPEPLRRVFCLRYYGGLSEAEVAADLGVSDRTVRTHWRAAIDALSVALTGKPFEGELPRLRREGEAAGSPLCPTRGAEERPSGGEASPPPAGPAAPG